MGQDAVFTHDGDKVGGYAHHQQVEQRDEGFEGDVVLLRISLHELEAYSAAAKVVERIAVVLALGIQHGHRRRQFLFGKMMVADDDIDAVSCRDLDFLNGLDAAVEGNQQAEAIVSRPLYALVRHSVSFFVTVGNVEIHLVGKALQEGIHQRHGGSAINIIIAIHENLLSPFNCLVQTLHGLVHILHQEGVMQVFETRTEESAGLLEGFHATLYKKRGQNLVDSHLRRKAVHLIRRSRFADYPFAFFGHSLQIYQTDAKKANILPYLCKIIPVTLVRSWRRKQVPDNLTINIQLSPEFGDSL